MTLLEYISTGWDHNNLSMDNIYVVILFFYINNDFNRHLVNWRLDFVSRQLTKKQQPVDLMRSKWLVNWQLVYSQLYVTIGNRELQLYMEFSMDSSNNQSWIWQLTSRQLTTRQLKKKWDFKQGGNWIKSYNIWYWYRWKYVFASDSGTDRQACFVWPRDVESTTRQACVRTRARCPTDGQIANGDTFPIRYTWFDIWRRPVFGKEPFGGTLEINHERETTLIIDAGGCWRLSLLVFLGHQTSSHASEALTA